MLQEFEATITTDGSGDANVDVGEALHGLLIALIYTPGDIATGADLTIKTKNNEIPILTVTNAGTSKVFYFPRALANEVADASQASAGSEMIPLMREPINVVVAQGGANNTGQLKAIWLTEGR